MADRVLTRVQGGVTESIHINTDKFAGVRTMTRSDGTTMSVDRTAPVITSDRVGESRPLLSKVVGGAAAAYSLRDLNDKAGNNKVVEVRRDGDHAERTFLAREVHKIADWVNGKEETTLPADVATSAAAYSLRKVRNDYTGYAVQIRRDTDNVEVNVAFDSNGEVSNSSAITNLPEEFLSNDFTDGWLEEAGATIVDSNTFTTTSNAQGVSLAVANGTKLKITVAGTATGASYRIYDWSDGGIKATLSGTFSTTVEFTTVGNQNKIYFRSTAAGTLDLTSLTIEVINDEGGDTTATTLGEFLTEGVYHDAFVVTWYDQSGNSNDATQPTTGSQPKIAEAGSLLTDGLKFDGVDDMLQTGTTVIDQTSAGTISHFGVVNVASDEAGYLWGSAGGADNLGTSLYARHNSSFTLTTGNKTIDTIARSGGTELVSTCYSNDSANLRVDGGGTQTSIGGYNFTVNDEFTIGNRDGGPSAPTFLNGSIKEIITYNSDQSTNRFKIESNINNHYGLPNVANEFASSETSFRFLQERGGGTSTSSDLTGFTLDVQTASAYAGAKFSTNVASGDSIYVSFDCSFDAGSPSPKVALRNVDSSLKGLLHSNEGLIVEGFNSFELTSTNNNASGIVFSEGDDNVIFTISNLKVSRISRNGFVETWYDQSGNGNDAVQPATGSQPKIVANGIYLGELDFDGFDDRLAGSHMLNTDDVLYAAVVAKNRDLSERGLFIANAFYNSATDNGGFSLEANTFNKGGKIAGWLDNTHVDSSVQNGLSSLTQNQIHLLSIDLSNGSSKFRLDGSLVNTLSAGMNSEDGGGTLGIGNGSSGTAGLDGSIKEVIIYNSDQSANRPAIEANINNQYSIY